MKVKEIREAVEVLSGKAKEITENAILEKLITGENLYFNAIYDAVDYYTMTRPDPFGITYNVPLIDHIKNSIGEIVVYVDDNGDIIAYRDEKPKTPLKDFIKNEIELFDCLNIPEVATIYYKILDYYDSVLTAVSMRPVA